MSIAHRWCCNCESSETGSCVNAVGDCPSSSAFTFTTPVFPLTYQTAPCANDDLGNPCTCTTTPASMPSTYTAGVVTNCINNSGSCRLDYLCEDDCTVSGCGECGVRNYDVTTVPAVLKICEGDTCTPYAQEEHNKVWTLGTSNGSTMLSGTRTTSCNDIWWVLDSETYGYGAATHTTRPALQCYFWIPQVVGFNAPSSADYWEYSIIWWGCVQSGCTPDVYCSNPYRPYIGSRTDPDEPCGNFVDTCGRTEGMQQLMDGYMTRHTGIFVVRKEIGSCYRATWNGVTQTASGVNVISITPPTTGSGSSLHNGYASIVDGTTGAWAPPYTSDPTFTECDWVAQPIYGGRYYMVDDISYGGDCSWSLT